MKSLTCEDSARGRRAARGRERSGFGVIFFLFSSGPSFWPTVSSTIGHDGRIPSWIQGESWPVDPLTRCPGTNLPEQGNRLVVSRTLMSIGMSLAGLARGHTGPDQPTTSPWGRLLLGGLLFYFRGNDDCTPGRTSASARRCGLTTTRSWKRGGNFMVSFHIT